MNYQNKDIARIEEILEQKVRELPPERKKSILRSLELRSLYDQLKTLPTNKRVAFGQEVNSLKKHLESLVQESAAINVEVGPIDVTAPFDINTPVAKRPQTLRADMGSRHPLMTELEYVLDIFYRMGFTAVESRQIDDEFHMFESLNFPKDHPARDDYDTFTTKEGYIAPAHASIMQNRLLKKYKSNLEADKPISVVYSGRTFRNEDVDARHEHTFYQVEILYVGKNINAGELIATFKTFLEEYYGQNLEIKSQPFYFPFTEPSFELALSCPFCHKKGCSICSHSGWIELLGMGMVHPQVLKLGGIDPKVYTGFAGGMGLDRLVFMKYGIEDIRHFEAGRLNFLRQFS